MNRRAIAIGGSAGSIPVLKRLLGQLPADLDAPVFVAVHVGSEGRNVLADVVPDALPPRGREGPQLQTRLAAGEHHLHVEYFEERNSASITLLASLDGEAPKPIPRTMLRAPDEGDEDPCGE